MEIRKIGTCGALAAGLALMGAAANAQAASVTYDSPVSIGGTGLGAVHTILNVQVANGQSDSEWGAVKWDGSSDVKTGSKVTGTGTIQTYTIAQLKSFGYDANNLAIIFNGQEPGNDKAVTLNSDNGFTVLFFDNAGNQILDATYIGPPNDFEVGTGVGSSGFLFNVVGENGDLAQVFADDTNRLGLEVSSDFAITNASASHETFFLRELPGTTTVPTPSAALAGLGMLSLLGLSRRKRRQTA